MHTRRLLLAWIKLLSWPPWERAPLPGDDWIRLCAALAGMPAFARAWSEREARLKCRGLALAEWRACDEPLLEACSCLSLVLAGRVHG
jgi:hypothetical protein